MKIHNVISIAYLEPYQDADPYRRQPVPPPAVVIDREEEVEIKRLLQKRRIRRGRSWSTQYLVRWLGYGPEHDKWIPVTRLSHARDLIDTYKQLFGVAAGVENRTLEPAIEARQPATRTRRPRRLSTEADLRRTVPYRLTELQLPVRRAGLRYQHRVDSQRLNEAER